MTLDVRPYGGADDVAAMQALASMVIADDPDCFPLHPGDIVHRMFNGLRKDQPALAELARLWEEDGELVQLACDPFGIGVTIEVFAGETSSRSRCRVGRIDASMLLKLCAMLPAIIRRPSVFCA